MVCFANKYHDSSGTMDESAPAERGEHAAESGVSAEYSPQSNGFSSSSASPMTTVDGANHVHFDTSLNRVHEVRKPTQILFDEIVMEEPDRDLEVVVERPELKIPFCEDTDSDSMNKNVIVTSYPRLCNNPFILRDRYKNGD